MKGLIKSDSDRLGFMASCLFAGAIDIEEMRQWVAALFEEEGTPPSYLVDLLEFNGPLLSIFKVIGFVPHWPYTKDEEKALLGITFKRGRSRFESPLTPEQAFAKLEKYPRIEARFRLEFPFVNLTAGPTGPGQNQ